MKIAKATAILVCGPLLGILVGWIVGIAMLKRVPSSPGHGFLIMCCIALSLFVSVCISLALAAAIFDKRAGTDSKSGHLSN